MTVKIFPSETYFINGLVLWRPNNKRSYIIDVNSIFPERFRERIKSTFAEKRVGSKVLEFSSFDYDKVNKVLFLEEKAYNVTPFIQNGKRWYTP